MRARWRSGRSARGRVAPVVGVPSRESRRFFGDAAQEASFDATVAALADAGARIVEVDFAPFFAVAAMLYEGAWVAERHVVVGPLLAARPGGGASGDPVDRRAGRGADRGDAFRGFYRLEALSARSRRCWRGSTCSACRPSRPS